MRQGKHSRQGRTPASDDETKDLQAQNLEGEDLGHEDEALPEGTREGGSEPSDLRTIEPEPAVPGDEPPGEPAVPGTPAIQTRAAHTRARRKFVDSGSGTERRSDWTRFDIGNVLRVLKTSENRGTLQREIRKLHLRWWQPGKAAMIRILSAAGLPKDVLELVADIVDTCKECRKWHKPGKEAIATFSVSTKFNEHVEMDLMFYRNYFICHFIDRASRWHAAQMVPGKEILI